MYRPAGLLDHLATCTCIQYIPSNKCAFQKSNMKLGSGSWGVGLMFTTAQALEAGKIYVHIDPLVLVIF